MILLNNKPVKLCSRRTCCPEITYHRGSNNFTITDDYGGRAHFNWNDIDDLLKFDMDESNTLLTNGNEAIGNKPVKLTKDEIEKLKGAIYAVKNYRT